MGPTLLFPPRPAAPATPSSHSTQSDPRASLRNYAGDALEEQSKDLVRSNEWLIGFMENLDLIRNGRKAGDAR